MQKSKNPDVVGFLDLIGFLDFVGFVDFPVFAKVSNGSYAKI